MKARAFDYERPATLQLAIEIVGSDESAKILAGGQSLGPMLNLRLIAPKVLVDVRRIQELARAEDTGDAIVLGACVTHAAIEDGDVIDGTRGIMPRIARGIAYRAVRNFGTIGGSLAHADPSADWLTSLAALGASVLIFGTAGLRAVPVSEFMVGVFETALRPGEIVQAVRIPKLSSRARWGFYKVCRKPGEFAEAMAAVLWDPERGYSTGRDRRDGIRPHRHRRCAARLLECPPDKAFAGAFNETAILHLLAADFRLGGDVYLRKIHLAALQRALAQVRAQ